MQNMLGGKVSLRLQGIFVADASSGTASLALPIQTSCPTTVAGRHASGMNTDRCADEHTHGQSTWHAFISPQEQDSEVGKKAEAEDSLKESSVSLTEEQQQKGSALERGFYEGTKE